MQTLTHNTKFSTPPTLLLILPSTAAVFLHPATTPIVVTTSTLYLVMATAAAGGSPPPPPGYLGKPPPPSKGLLDRISSVLSKKCPVCHHAMDSSTDKTGAGRSKPRCRYCATGTPRPQPQQTTSTYPSSILKRKDNVITPDPLPPAKQINQNMTPRKMGSLRELSTSFRESVHDFGHSIRTLGASRSTKSHQLRPHTRQSLFDEYPEFASPPSSGSPPAAFPNLPGSGRPLQPSGDSARIRPGFFARPFPPATFGPLGDDAEDVQQGPSSFQFATLPTAPSIGRGGDRRSRSPSKSPQRSPDRLSSPVRSIRSNSSIPSLSGIQFDPPQQLD